mmetsp:Transcript_72315/g.182370  ORF Transcript_72315/g.182370 Transcript_72315/m.182370 type:complete len:307 (-) Transcript_72315:98-1018(-)
MTGVLPSLREGAVVEQHVAPLVLAQDTILHILLDGVHGLACGNLELFAGPLRNLTNEVVGPVAVLQRHVVPRRQTMVVLLEVDAVPPGSNLALLLGCDPRNVGVLEPGLQHLEALTVALLRVVAVRVRGAVVEQAPPPHELVEVHNVVLFVLGAEKVEHVFLLLLVHGLPKQRVHLLNIGDADHLARGLAQPLEDALHRGERVRRVFDDQVRLAALLEYDLRLVRPHLVNNVLSKVFERRVLACEAVPHSHGHGPLLRPLRRGCPLEWYVLHLRLLRHLVHEIQHRPGGGHVGHHGGKAHNRLKLR